MCSSDNKTCIEYDKFCDEIEDCPNGEDEFNCTYGELYKAHNIARIYICLGLLRQ